MYFRQNFGLVKTILISLIAAGTTAIIGVDISLLVNKDFMTQAPAVAIVSMIASILITGFALLMLFNSFYKMKEDKFIACLGFFVDKIKYEDILGMKQNSVTNDLYLVIKNTSPSRPPMLFRMNLSKDKIDLFIEKIREKRTDLPLETFEPRNKK